MPVRFGAFELDRDLVELRCDGEVVPVQPQVFELIDFLIDHRDRVVTKYEVLDKLWGHRFVSDAALAGRIKLARRAVGDSGTTQSVIKTVPGRGYRFVAEVRADQPEVIEDAPVEDQAAPHMSTPATVPMPPASVTGDNWPFVGRFEEVDRVVHFAENASCAGVVVTADPDGGLTSFLARCVERLVADGFAITRVVGLESTSAIPLAALSSLVPIEIAESMQAAGPLSEGAVFRRVLASVSATLGERAVVVVDDTHLLDSLSRAVLAWLATSGSAFVLAAQRPSAGGQLVFDDLIRDETLTHLPLAPLDETEIDIVLFRVLAGPIDPEALRRLSEASAGRPGLLRDIVEASRRAGTLVEIDGTWRVTGALVNTKTVWPIDDLSPEAVRAAEALAVIGMIGVAELFELFGDAAVDDLDQRHMLTVDHYGNDEVVHLSEPLLAETINQQMTGIRLRHLRSQLFDVVLNGRKLPTNMVTLVSWAADDARDVSRVDALGAAQRALMAGDETSAQILVDFVGHDDPELAPFVRALHAELLFRRGQYELAGEEIERIDQSALDEMIRAYMIRRAMTIRCFLNDEYAECVEWLEQAARDESPLVARAMDGNRTNLLTMLGRVDEAVELGAPMIDDVHPQIDVEVTLSLARAHVLGGDLASVASLLDRFDNDLDHVFTGAAAAEPREGAASIRLISLMNAGEINAASSEIRAGGYTAKRSTRSWLPLAAAEVDIEAGRFLTAREVLRRAVATNRNQRLRHGLIASQTFFLRTSAELGMRGDAGGELDAVLAQLPSINPSNSWLVGEHSARAAHLLDRGDECVELLLTRAEQARDHGALLTELSLRSTAALVASEDAVASHERDRVRELADYIGGRVWPIRASVTEARADGRSAASEIAELRALGYRALADAVEFGSDAVIRRAAD